MMIGAKIKRLRVTRRVTQAELAKKIGVSQAQVSYFETDFRTPSLGEVREISLALGVTLDWLLDGQDTVDSMKQVAIAAVGRELQKVSLEEIEALRSFYERRNCSVQLERKI